jgi:hypothetical protein
MTNRIRGAAPLAALALFVAAAPAAQAVPVTVNLRVEGLNRTVFDAPVTTDAHPVTTATAGTHTCDGTNGGAEPAPGPTATGALDDAARLAGFTIDGPYGNFGIDDYFIERVADEQVDPMTQFWSLWINHTFSDKGGCQKRVLAGQDVLWAAIPFSAEVPLKLSGPPFAQTGRPVQVRVIDGQTGTAQADATVGGATTDAGGVANLSFATAGIYRLKAEKPGTIRSNTIVLCVDPPEADPCSSADRAAPAVQWRLPGRLASDGGRSRTILVSWQADDGTGSGVAHYSVDVRELADGAGPGPVAPADWRGLLDRSPANGLHFRGEAGDAYQFRITAADRAANSAAVETEPVVIPIDDRSRRLWRFSSGWKRVRAEAAWGRTVVRASRPGLTARLRFRGTRVALIGRRLARGGRLRVTLDGRSRVLRVRGRSAHRSVLWTSRRVPAGGHSLAVRSLGGGTVELDAVAPSP